MASGLTILNMRSASDEEKINNAPASMKVPRHSANPCAECAGLCCALTVHVTVQEAFRIAHALSVDVLHVVEPWPVAEEPRGFMSPPPFQLDVGMRQLAMMRRNDTLSCAFLVAVGKRGVCGIYGMRPHVCAMFPYRFEIDGVTRGVGSQEKCPSTWLSSPGDEEKLEIHHSGVLQDLEKDRALIHRWNQEERADRSYQAFMRFCADALREDQGANPKTTWRVRRRLGERLW